MRPSSSNTPCWPRRPAASPRRRSATSGRWPATSPAPLVLVFPQRVSLLQGRRQSVLLLRRREPVPRDLRRRAELHRPSVGYRARADGARRHLPGCRTGRRAQNSGVGIFRAAAGERAAGERPRQRGRARRRCRCPRPGPAPGAPITKFSTAKPGRTRSSAPPSCSRWISRSSVAPAWSSAAWRRFPGGCRKWRRCSTGQRMTEELAAKAGEAAVAGARPLSKNAYKVPLTKNMVKRTLVELSARA